MPPTPSPSSSFPKTLTCDDTVLTNRTLVAQDRKQNKRHRREERSAGSLTADQPRADFALMSKGDGTRILNDCFDSL